MHETRKYGPLGSNHTHPRAASAAMLLAGLCHRSTSGLETPCSILSSTHPNVGDGSHFTNTWYPPNVGHQPTQTNE